MILELLMNYCGWEAVWAPHAGHRAVWRPCLGGPWFVGTWTGPQHDLICVKRCATLEEAAGLISPPGRTILHAALLSLWKRWRRR